MRQFARLWRPWGGTHDVEPKFYRVTVQGADQMLPRRECSAAGSALTLLRPPPSAVHGHSVRACTSSVGQRLPVDARAECLHSFGAVEQ